MRNSVRIAFLTATMSALAVTGQAQSVELTVAQYEQMKATGTLPSEFHMLYSTVPNGTTPVSHPVDPEAIPPIGGEERGGGGDDCDCWIEPDGSYTTQGNWPLGSANFDDGSAGPFALPFSFDLYGDLYEDFYLNINGNISFLEDYFTFTAEGFPSANFIMVAPFWADVQLTNDPVGTIKWKVTDHALYVNWSNVGYYNQHTDKRNTFQLIITDGTDPVIGVGNNVSFCYKDMQWTTGDASQGVNGFGGVASTVGANRGNGTDFIQFTRNDHAGTDYDGPFGNPDGISWLDFKNFIFTTQTTSENVAPIASGLYLCDTLRACVGQVSQLEVTFLAPENNQITTASSTAPTIASWTEIANSSGIVASVTGEFIATADELGFHQVTYTATDDGVPNLTTTVQIVIEVIPPPSEPPGITGNSAICTGQSTVLTATGPYSSFVWSTGQTGPSIVVSQPGSYTVTGGIGLCQLVSDPFVITQVTPPPLFISGPTEYCGDPLPILVASPGYEGYVWSGGGGTNDSLQTGAGTYTVTGSYQGCENISAPFTLLLVDPGPPVITGDATYCEGLSSTIGINASAYTSFLWSTNETTPQINVTTGTYTVSAEYLNCSYTSAPFTVTETILPPVTITGDNVICEDGVAFLVASPGFQYYSWSPGGATGPNVNFQAGTYTVTATTDGCSTQSDPFTITEVPSPVPVITGPTFSCGGTPVVLTTTEPFASYEWSNGAETQSTSVTSGSYTVTVTNAEGCSATSDPYSVVVASDPVAAFSTTPDSPQPMGSTILFEDNSTVSGGTITAWDWTFNNAGDGSTEQNPAWTYPTPADYIVTLIVTTSDGCTDTTSMMYTIFPPEITIPNVFTPNGDEANDVFEITNIIYWTNELKIYSRWGNVVYETRNYKNTWKGDDVPDGTYYYLLTLGDGREWAGHLTVLR